MANTMKDRVARLIAGGTHALLDRLEGAAPSAVLAQSVREIDQVIDDVRTELGRTVANRHLAQQQHLHLNREHETLADSLATALSGGRDDLATPAISRQLDIEAQLPILESSLAQLAGDEKELSSFVDALMGKKREMENAIAAFERSRATAASVAANNGTTASAAQARADAAQSSFDRVYARQTGLEPAAQSASLQQSAKLKELGDLVRSNKIAERLAALKAQQK